jgi:hypothetical protein
LRGLAVNELDAAGLFERAARGPVEELPPTIVTRIPAI